MLNDKIFETYYPTQRRFFRPSSFYEVEMDHNRRILAAATQEQERRRRYKQAALEKQAYLQELKEMRIKRLMKEQERMRAEQERKRQARLEEERRCKDVALAAFMRREAMKKRRMTPARCCTEQSSYRIVQGSGGNFYKVFLNPNLDQIGESPEELADCNIVPSSTFDEEDDEESLASSSISDDEMTFSEGFNPAPYFERSILKSTINNNNWSNHNENGGNSDLASAATSIPIQEKGSRDTKKSIKSEVLVGDVEDASDNECELNDYFHTRKPSRGQWIEPVDHFERR